MAKKYCAETHAVIKDEIMPAPVSKLANPLLFMWARLYRFAASCPLFFCSELCRELCPETLSNRWPPNADSTKFRTKFMTKFLLNHGCIARSKESFPSVSHSRLKRAKVR